MPFARPRSVITSDKHEITWSNLDQDASTTVDISIATGVPFGSANLANEVPIGAIIKSVYFEFHFSAALPTNPKVIHWKVEYIPSAMVETIPSTYYQNDRRFIIKRGMEMLPEDVSTVFKRIFVVKLGRYQRQLDGGILQFSYISTSAEAINACGFAIYKAYT